ncbi:MAG TPA: hypothetical protein VH044_08210 [Polyangiaceae bacterium]|nr:hypothetical protein [Polyangiaceae bacterium]
MAHSKKRRARAVVVGIWVAAVCAGMSVTYDLTRLLLPDSTATEAPSHSASVSDPRRDLGVAERQAPAATAQPPLVSAVPAVPAVPAQVIDANIGQAAQGVLYVPGVTIAAPWPQVP